jgi:3-deoxy-D-manno-octulosonate 8-phosphate phosphatase (KDO 8-P phosphatase)
MAADPSDPSLRARASRIRLLLFDVDGVLTDGTVVLHADGSESKRFSIRDGSGMVLARRAGLLVGLLSGRASDATLRRAAELGLPIVVQGTADKLGAYEAILREHGLEDRDAAYMGDDVQDLPVLARAGLSAAPADAVAEVRSRVDWVSAAPGGSCAPRHGGMRWSPTWRRQDKWIRTRSRSSPRSSRCSSASRSAKRGNGTSCRTAPGSIGGATAIRRTTFSA